MATSRQGDAPPADPKADLTTRLADPAFTPSVKKLGDLLDLFAHDDEDVAKNAERAVLRIETQYAARLAKETIARARTAERPARGRLARLAGRLAAESRDPEGLALAWLLEALGDGDPKTRRAAARGLGKLSITKTIEEALAAAFDRAENDDDKRAIALALGKTGSEAARSRLATGQHGRASVIVDRELARRAPGAIAPTAAPTGPVRIWFHTRSGLEDVLKDELGTSFGKARFVAPGVVEGELEGPLSQALAIRTATHVGFPLASFAKGAEPAADIVGAIGSDEALAIFRAFTARAVATPIRFRLEFTRGGHRRAVVWKVAELVREKASELLNDPKESTWEVVVDEAGDRAKLELVPRGYLDERFAYRGDLVAASSHPTIAAALARVAPRSDGDIVWDPFSGAAAELVERARLGPYSRLIATDTDPKALAAARANANRAGLGDIVVEEADACRYSPAGVTLIITNPPMGRRVQRGSHADLLGRFVTHAADILAPGGALVWLVPEPRPIQERAEKAGLVLDRAFSVDMGGFSAELAVYVKPATKKGRRIVGQDEAPQTATEQRKRGGATSAQGTRPRGPTRNRG